MAWHQNKGKEENGAEGRGEVAVCSLRSFRWCCQPSNLVQPRPRPAEALTVGPVVAPRRQWGNKSQGMNSTRRVLPVRFRARRHTGRGSTRCGGEQQQRAKAAPAPLQTARQRAAGTISSG